MADTNDSQNNANLDFVQDPEKDKQLDIHVDITGKNDSEVVEQLKFIVNSSDYCETSMFTFEIKSENAESELFRLEPNPTDTQPGNGKVSYVHRDTKLETGHGYGVLNHLLKEEYKGNTQLFAKHINEVFKNNKEISNVPPITAETYMLLLFEIGRRLVSAKKSSLDKLPIGIVIARLVKLLEAKRCTFKDVFLKGKQFHCFSGNSTQRETAINEINAAYESFTNAENLNEDDTNSEQRGMFCRE